MHIHVKNYKKVKDAVVNVHGLTVLVGPTNHGKTAFLSAVQTALYGQLGTSYIKAGSAFTEIILKYHRNDIDIEWVFQKEAKSHQILYNGRPISKFKGIVPNELLEEIGFGQVDLEGSLIRPNFQEQLEPLFGFREKSTKLFTLLLSFSEYENLPKVRRQVDKDLAETRHAMSVLEHVQAQAKERIGRYEVLAARLDGPEVAKTLRAFEAAETQEALVRLLTERDHGDRTATMIEAFLKRTVDAQEDLNLFFDQALKYERLRQLLMQRGKLEGAIDRADDVRAKLELCETELSAKSKMMAEVIRVRKLLTDRAQVERVAEGWEAEIPNRENDLEQLRQQLKQYDQCPECGAPIRDGVYYVTGDQAAAGTVEDDHRNLKGAVRELPQTGGAD